MNKPQLKTVIQATEETKKKGYSIPEGFIGKMSIVFAQEEYNEHIRNVIENALEIAASSVKKKIVEINACDDHTPYMGACGTCGHYYMPKIEVVTIDTDSITNTLEQTLEKWKI